MARRPRRALLVPAALLTVFAASCYLAFELGRYQAGYAVMDVSRELAELQRNLDRRDQAIAGLERQVAVLETSREIDRATYQDVEENLAGLQARIHAQQEELEFYRGIVSPADGPAGPRIQTLELVSQDAEGRYALRLILVQAIAQTRDVAGVVTLEFAGVGEGGAAVHRLADLVVDDAPGELEYAFRYFQTLETQLRLPSGFEPERIEVRIVPSEPRGDASDTSFRWSDVAG